MNEDQDEVKKEVAGLTAMAKRLGFKGDEITKYVHEHMTKLGYKSKRSYFREEKTSGGNGGGFLGLFGGSSDSSDDDL